MRKLIFLSTLLFNVIVVPAQQSGTMFVAAKTSLSIREKPNAEAKVIDKIPYGTKITIIQAEEELKTITVEGMKGYWQKVNYNNKTGFIIDSYLFPSPPPKLATVKELKNYLTQISTPFGAKLTVKSGAMNNIAEGGWEMQKQLYKNGAEWHHNMGYEYGSDTYFLPNFTLEQGFLLLRLIPEFKMVFGEKDEYPTQNKTIKRGENDYSIKIEKVTSSDSEYSFIKRISVEYADGAFYSFDMYLIDNQLVVSFSSGV